MCDPGAETQFVQGNNHSAGSRQGWRGERVGKEGTIFRVGVRLLFGMWADGVGVSWIWKMLFGWEGMGGGCDVM